MGKKASLKINLDYDFDDEYGYDNGEYDEYWDDDVPDYGHKNKREASKQKVKTKTPTTNNHTSSTNRPASIHGNLTSQSLAVKLFHKRPQGSPFSTLLLLQGQDLFLHVAQYLHLRSIAALSCTCRQASQILEQDILYCRGSPDKQKNANNSGGALLPCMRGMELPKLQNARLCRRTAIESTIFRRQNGRRDRNFELLASIHPAVGTPIHQCFLSKSGTRLSYLIDPGELITHKINPSTTNNRASGQGSATKPTPTTTLPLRQRIPGCNNVLASAVSKDGSHCAILSMPSTGIRRYALTVLTVGDELSASPSIPPLFWQKDIAVPTQRSTKIARPPSVQCHNNRIVVVASGCCSVFDGVQQTLEWDFDLDSQDEHPWHVWTIHEEYIIALVGAKKKKGLCIYDMQVQRLVARGILPSPYTFSSTDLAQRVPELLVCQDRIWLARYPRVICTGNILRRLRSRRRCDNETTSSSGRSSQTKPSPPVLTIQKYLFVTEVSSRLPLLYCTSDMESSDNHGTNNTILLADGNVIKIFVAHDGDDGQGSSSSSSWNTTAANGIEPDRIICAEGPMEHFRADSTKIICAIQDGKKRRLEILRLVDTVDGGSLVLEHSVFVKNAAVFTNRQGVDGMDYKVDSGKLLVQYTSNRGDGSAIRTELRVFNLIDTND